MRKRMLTSKIHRATVTDANIDYVGSITLDKLLIEAAGLVEFEQVAVLDVTNGVRLETYVIEGPSGSGAVCINGAAAHLVRRGDRVIVVAYSDLDVNDLLGFRPAIVHVDADNAIISAEQAAAWVTATVTGQ